jgi:aspartate carbamoyltransferase regulatory subunit
MSEAQLLVRRIKDGTVIDHIDPGMALVVLDALNMTGREGNVITVAMNVPSGKLEKKDIIKVENRFLESNETNKLALLAPKATVNIIRDYKVIEKRKVELPNEFVAIFKCPNPKCVTNSKEEIKPIIDVIDKRHQKLKCRYCNRILNLTNSSISEGLIYAQFLLVVRYHSCVFYPLSFMLRFIKPSHVVAQLAEIAHAPASSKWLVLCLGDLVFLPVRIQDR